MKELKAKEEREGEFELKIEEMLGFEELYRKKCGEEVDLPILDIKFWEPALILHSSGMCFSGSTSRKRSDILLNIQDQHPSPNRVL